MDSPISEEELRVIKERFPLLKIAPAPDDKGVGMFVTEDVKAGTLLYEYDSPVFHEHSQDSFRSLLDPFNTFDDEFNHIVSVTKCLPIFRDELARSDPRKYVEQNGFDENQFMGFLAFAEMSVQAIHSGRFHGVDKMKDRLDVLAREWKCKDATDAILLFNIAYYKLAVAVLNPFGSERFGTALCPIAARCNHSCIPNSFVGSIQLTSFLINDAEKTPRTIRVTIRPIRDLKAGDEITLCYCAMYQSRKERMDYLKRVFGFVCHCERCSFVRPSPRKGFLPHPLDDSPMVLDSSVTEAAVTRDYETASMQDSHRLAKKFLKKYRDSINPYHPYVREITEYLAMDTRLTPADRVKYGEHCLKLSMAVYGEGQLRTLVVLFNLIRSCGQAGMQAQKRKYQEQLLRIGALVFGPLSAEISTNKEIWAEVLSASQSPI